MRSRGNLLRSSPGDVKVKRSLLWHIKNCFRQRRRSW